MQNLNRKTANKQKTLPLKVMQFGGGNFLRAFVNYMVQILNQETDFNGGVVIVKPTERGNYQTLKSQNGLFTVVLDGIRNGKLIAEKTLIDCVQEIINPYLEWDAYLELAKNPDIRFIVSNTTEAGIQFNPLDKFSDTPPKEFPAKLTLWLHQRFLHFGNDISKGCILLPCELIENNGETLKTSILQYVEHWKLDPNFLTWISTANHFCSTLVDRIVSGYPKDRAMKITTNLGYKDNLLVAGEYYHSWVIKGAACVPKELPFKQTNLNVTFVNDLVPYREMKVRILNGAHTSMVPIGYLAGYLLVKEVMDDAVLSNFIEALLVEETNTTLNFPEAELQKFAQDVMDRFRNPLLQHKLLSISLNSTSKFVARLLPTLNDFYIAKGKFPQRIVFGFSALILFYKGEFDGEKIALMDDPSILQFFAEQWAIYNANKSNINTIIATILSNTDIWKTDLTKFEGLVAQVAKNIISIKEIGILETIVHLDNL